MNLFLKIFLWFLAAISLMVGVIFFLSWTVQTEPVVSRWRISVRNQTNIYSATADQILEREGPEGLRQFLDRIRASETMSDVVIIGMNGSDWPAEARDAAYTNLAARAIASDAVEIEFNQPETALSARAFGSDSGGQRYVMIIRWDRPRMTPFFGESPLRYLRYAGLFLTAVLLCWALARYLASPIGKIRRATQKLAGGELQTRVANEVGNRRDELAHLAKDFDVMAERIESLITSQQRLSQDVSHELRSPLARMNVALEIAKQRSNGASAVALARIEKESGQLNEMISRLLTLSRLESGAETFENQDVDLTGLLEHIAADADFEANAKGRSVKIVSMDDCRISGSESLIKSAVENVLRNAVKYTAEGTAVEVALARAGSRTQITVRDFGGGVPENELDKLFQPFYRVSESRERKTGGTGLGLAIAERAIKAHKGTIAARNSEGGLTVTIELECKTAQVKI